MNIDVSKKNYEHVFSKSTQIKMDYEKDLDLAKHHISEKNIKQILEKIETPLDNERCEWLRSRPWWTSFHTIFQRYLEKQFVGTHLVAHIDPVSAIILTMIDTVQIPCDKYNMLPMEPSHCHDNSENLFFANPKLRIFTGYALSVDGLWRHHSWVTNEQGVITETTEPRLIYIGCDLSNVYRSNSK